MMVTTMMLHSVVETVMEVGWFAGQ